ncbi:MAG: porin family protein, partial [Polyangiaceae bacterium]|nr:porin family protein [Polyangiaceae bacterium]
IDSNQMKTVAGRVSSRAPIGAGLEVGVSGSYGAQDLQDDGGVIHWHYGVDLHLDWNDFDFTAEFLQGQAEGASIPTEAPCELTQCLRYKGAYGQLGYRWLNWLTPYARVDFRDALHQNGESFVYISELLRVTGGARFEIGSSVIVKAEYTVTRELGKAPEFPNDVLTSSMIIRH